MTDKYLLPEFAVSRIRYYDGLFLTDQDFIDEQNYHVSTARRQARLLHTAGITEGLDVAIASGGTAVSVSAGSALDKAGRQILLAVAGTVFTDPLWNNGVRYLEITFREVESGIADENSAVASATRFTQSPLLALNASPTEGAVLLAAVTILGGVATSIDKTGRVYSGVRLPTPTGVSAIELAASNDGKTAELSSDLRVSGAASLDSTLDVAGAAAVDGALSVTGATSLSNTLAVTGNTGLATGSGSALTVGGPTTVNNTLAVTGKSSLADVSAAAITASGASKITNTLEVTGSSTLAALSATTINATGASKITNTLEVTGSSTLAALSATTINATGASKITNTLEVTGSSTLAALSATTINATGASKITNTLEVTGSSTLAALSATTINASGASKITNTLEVTQKSTLAGVSASSLSVTGASTLAGVSASSLSVTGASTLAGVSASSLSVTGASTLAGVSASSLSVTGASTLAGVSASSLSVTGASTLAGVSASSLSVTGASTLAGMSATTISATGATKITNTLEVTGTSTLATVNATSLNASAASKISNTFEVTAATTLGGDLALTGDRTINFNATSTGQILFNSKANPNSDKAFIFFKDNSSFVYSSTENMRLSIGVYNDFGSSAAHMDAMDLQGGAQLTLNAGSFDTELSTAMGGVPGVGTFLKGISFRINNAEKMVLNTSGLTVSTPTTVSSTLGVTGALTASSATQINSTLGVTGNTSLATASGSTLSVGGTSTFNGDMTLTGGRFVFAPSAQNMIVFESSVNYVSDKAFIVWKANSTVPGTGSEYARLSIGVLNDADGGDALDIQGCSKLILNAGQFDTELAGIMGANANSTNPYGLSLCVNNSEKMRVTSAGIIVPSGVYMQGPSVVEFKTGSQSYSSSGDWMAITIKVTFSKELHSAMPMLQGWRFDYVDRMYVKKAGAWIESQSVSGNTCTFSIRCMWEDDNHDDDWTGVVYYGVVGVLKYTV